MEQEITFETHVSARKINKLFSRRRHAFPRKLKKAIKQCWQIERSSLTMSVTFNCLKKTKHQRKASNMIKIIPETKEILIPNYNGMYVCYKCK